MTSFTPLNPTGYNDCSVWETAPGFEITVYVSPKLDEHIAHLIEREKLTHAKVVGGFVFGYFEFVESEVHDALEDPSHTHTWMTYFNDHPVAALLIVHMDDFNMFLLHSDEASLIQSRLDSGESDTDLTWVKISLQGETGLSVLNI